MSNDTVLPESREIDLEIERVVDKFEPELQERVRALLYRMKARENLASEQLSISEERVRELSRHHTDFK